MAIHARVRKEYRRFIARWRRGVCTETWLTRGDGNKTPADVEEQRRWLRSILGHYGRLAADSGARLFRARLFGLKEAMPCTPLGEKDPDGWRAESHRDLERCHRIQLGIALACRRLLRDMPPPVEKKRGDLFDMLNPESAPKATRKKKV